jgi:hypothetical protein
MKPLFLLSFLFFCLGPIAAQESVAPPEYHKKGSFAFYWGYNRSYYSKTNLHFTGPDYDFTVYHLSGTDRPSKFGSVYVNPVTFTIPQYVFRLSYFLTDRLAISGGMDHMKYVVTQDQWTTISGVVTQQASPEYAGSYLHQAIQLKSNLLSFEHTNGFNLMSLDFEYLQPLFGIQRAKLKFYWNTGIGGIWIVAKTDVRVFEDGLDNDFHIAGYTLAGKTGPRVEYKNRVFLAAELKGGYATLPSVLIANDAPEIGDHNLGFLEYYIAVGVNFRLGKKKPTD